MNIKNIHVNMLDRACTVGKIDRNQCQELKSESGYHASHEISGGLGTRAQRVVFFLLQYWLGLGRCLKKIPTWTKNMHQRKKIAHGNFSDFRAQKCI